MIRGKKIGEIIDIEIEFELTLLTYPKESKIGFENRKWNYPNKKWNNPNRKWNYFSYFRTSDQKTVLTNIYHFY